MRGGWLEGERGFRGESISVGREGHGLRRKKIRESDGVRERQGQGERGRG